MQTHYFLEDNKQYINLLSLHKTLQIGHTPYIYIYIYIYTRTHVYAMLLLQINYWPFKHLDLWAGILKNYGVFCNNFSSVFDLWNLSDDRGIIIKN